MSNNQDFEQNAPRLNMVQVGTKMVRTMTFKAGYNLKAGELVEYTYHGATYRSRVVSVRPHSMSGKLLVSTSRHHFEMNDESNVWRVMVDVLEFNNGMRAGMVGAGALSVNEALWEMQDNGGAALSWGNLPVHSRLVVWGNTDNRD